MQIGCYYKQFVQFHNIPVDDGNINFVGMKKKAGGMSKYM